MQPDAGFTRRERRRRRATAARYAGRAWKRRTRLFTPKPDAIARARAIVAAHRLANFPTKHSRMSAPEISLPTSVAPDAVIRAERAARRA